VDRLSSQPSALPSDPFAGHSEPWRFGPPAAEALSQAYQDAVQLLFRPFNGLLWTKLSLACLFLGGGTLTAAFQWSLSALPSEIRLDETLARVEGFFAQNLGLIILAITLGLALGIALLFLRSFFRFVLVDAIAKREVSIGPAWTALRPLAESYFFWLFVMLAGLGLTFSIGAILTLPYLRVAASSHDHPIALSLALLAILTAVVLAGVAVALFITVTDDLAVPLMYAERWPLPTAWRKLLKMMRADPGTFVVYILLRLAISIVVGIAVLLLLVPALVSVFSGAIILAALVVLSLHLLGFAWAWNPITVALALAALVLLIGVLLILLSVAGMPGQVFLQDYGLRFILPRLPVSDAFNRQPGNSAGPL
jgi:hypothetical protein